jgi:hypothetical protein
MSQHPVTGRDLYEALHLDNTTLRNDTAWHVLARRSHMNYEKAAQHLNVQLGFIAPTHRSYLFALECATITLVDDLAGLLACLEQHIKPYDRFEIYVIENGKEIGYGWYERGVINGQLLTWEWTGCACGLADLLNEKLSIRTLPSGGAHV